MIETIDPDLLRHAAAVLDGGEMGDVTKAFDPLQAATSLRVLADWLEQDGWISVEDRLPPDDSGQVLVWHPQLFDGGQPARFDVAERAFGKWVRYGVVQRLVTHWMPLPEPPE